MFIALVMVIALTSAMYGIELFKVSMLDYNQIALLDSDGEHPVLPLVDLLINTISLAFLADNSTFESYKNITALLKHDNIDNFPDLKKSIEEIKIFDYLIKILFLIVIFF